MRLKIGREDNESNADALPASRLLQTIEMRRHTREIYFQITGPSS